MNSKERVAAAFKKEKTDKIPINHRAFCSKVASYILGREAFVGGGIQQWREAKSYWESWHDEYLERSFKDAIEIALITNQDTFSLFGWRAPEIPTRKIDDNTYLYGYGEEENWRILRYDPQSEQATFFYYHPREVTSEDIKKEVREGEKTLSSYQPTCENYDFQIRAQKLYGEEKVVEVGGVGIGISLRRASAWLPAMLLDPGLIEAFISLEVETAKKDVEFLSKHGFQYFFGGLDFASDQGPVYSPKLFRDLTLPGLKRVSEICHQYQGYHLFASDGNLWPVADMLFEESGVDGYYEIDRKAGMDLEKLRREYPNLTLMGNISSWTLSQGSKEDVKREVLSCLEIAKKYKGVIVGVSNNILPDAPFENVDMMLETLNKNR